MLLDEPNSRPAVCVCVCVRERKQNKEYIKIQTKKKINCYDLAQVAATRGRHTTSAIDKTSCFFFLNNQQTN